LQKYSRADEPVRDGDRSDPARLEQVVSNLIDNAIKYTDSGGKIFIELRQSGNEAVLSVRDTGIGIPQEEIAHLFDRFYRVDKARSRGTGGTGLGLSIVDKIVQLHNGYIEVHSEEGVGSEFIVRLPIDQNHD
jgi:signal transduction histidine kinase